MSIVHVFEVYQSELTVFHELFDSFFCYIMFVGYHSFYFFDVFHDQWSTVSAFQFVAII